jgi:hypothetical protein
VYFGSHKKTSKMKDPVTIGRWFFAICLLGLAGQQFYYADFRPVFVPTGPSPLPGIGVLAYLFGIILVGAALALVLERQARRAMLLLGGIFLALDLFCHLPNKLFVEPGNIASWTNTLKELAFAGSAFVIAGSLPAGATFGQQEPAIFRLLEKFIPLGGIFFSIMLILFGVDHFIYAPYVAQIVPDWIPPGQLFWTYFAGVALIAAGVSISLELLRKQSALLLGAAIFIWFLVLHIPRAAVAPVSDKGNELTSVFESLGFSGVAFVIAYTWRGIWSKGRVVPMEIGANRNR